MRGLNDHYYMVTGASSGIGRAVAQRLSEEGSRIILVARRQDALEETKASLRGNGHLLCPCDLSNSQSVRDLFKELQTLDQIHGIAHCAGIHWLRPLKISRTEAVMEMLQSHIANSIALTQAYTYSQLAPKTGSSVVWLSSIAALKGEVGASAYSAAKGGMISAARSLAVELASRHLRINTVSPGVVRTPQGEALLGALPESQRTAVQEAHLLGIIDPSDVANTVTFLLSEESSKITGTNLVIDSGFSIH